MDLNNKGDSMKKAILTLALILMATTVHAQFTAEQETNLKLVADNIDKLIQTVQIADKLQALADNEAQSTLPLQIEKKRVERVAKIKERDDAIAVIKAQAISDVNDLMATYEVQIDAIESEITALQNTLEGLSQ